jgi:Txe/YoeB family toxin of toxin-antitoxin system
VRQCGVGQQGRRGFDRRDQLPSQIALIADIKRDPDGPGIGKLEVLQNNLAGLRSRRIDDEHRLVYAVEPDEITIISCRYHYG